MKKGESLSMNVIVIAAIALLVLVILAVMLLKQTDAFGKGNSCAQIGVCASECNPTTETLDISRSGVEGRCAEGEVCCITISRE